MNEEILLSICKGPYETYHVRLMSRDRTKCYLEMSIDHGLALEKRAHEALVLLRAVFLAAQEIGVAT